MRNMDSEQQCASSDLKSGHGQHGTRQVDGQGVPATPLTVLYFILEWLHTTGDPREPNQKW